MPSLVTSLSQVIENIRTYQKGVATHPQLAGRIKQHPAWYAVKGDEGRWLFGPSKFIGYRGATTDSYLDSYNRRDGKETEPTLEQWFSEVDPSTLLGKELRASFEAFADAYGKGANARWRVSIPIDELSARSGRAPTSKGFGRIAFDPDILGGRPHIRGTRVGVGHILAALAAGDTADEIVEELPYLAHDDIRAALEYAVANIDHPVFVAA